MSNSQRFADSLVSARDLMTVELVVDGVVEAVKETITELRGRIEALEQRPPSPEYRGIFRPTETYHSGALVTHRGSLWLGLRDSAGATPGSAPDAWKLIVKSGHAPRED
jgi:hypothetical protein